MKKFNYNYITSKKLFIPFPGLTSENLIISSLLSKRDSLLSCSLNDFLT